MQGWTGPVFPLQRCGAADVGVLEVAAALRPPVASLSGGGCAGSAALDQSCSPSATQHTRLAAVSVRSNQDSQPTQTRLPLRRMPVPAEGGGPLPRLQPQVHGREEQPVGPHGLQLLPPFHVHHRHPDETPVVVHRLGVPVVRWEGLVQGEQVVQGVHWRPVDAGDPNLWPDPVRVSRRPRSGRRAEHTLPSPRHPLRQHAALRDRPRRHDALHPLPCDHALRAVRPQYRWFHAHTQHGPGAEHVQGDSLALHSPWQLGI
mmetsp:Transcript_50500/g.133044  ORF Transcript_50500/g.133044 Transcript_50500/m.133044 type:complete len:260 (+) Transcript_50500:161-940(+)